MAQCAYLKNVQFDEYLYPMADPLETEELHQIATRRRSPQSSTNGKSSWLIEPDQTPGFVTIRNVELKQYLTTVGNRTRDPQRRNVFTSTERSPAALWTILPIAPCRCLQATLALACRLSRPAVGQFHIISQLHGEYLYAAADDLAIDEDNRNIFTWIDEEREPAAYWNPYEFNKPVWIIEKTKC